MTSQVDTRSDRVFISHSHKDLDFAQRLGEALERSGEAVWLVHWELQPGDSLIEKIFEEGLANASAFLILLSPDSVNSKWVKEELNFATVQRIEKLTRVIPILVKTTDIPTSLRTLVWLDMRTDFNAGVERLLNTLYRVSSRPQVQTEPAPQFRTLEPVAGVSKAATAAALYLLRINDPNSAYPAAASANQLHQALEMDAGTLNDAIDELEHQGMVRAVRELGTHPYRFTQVEPTYVLYREFVNTLQYRPTEDEKQVATCLASLRTADANTLREQTQLSPGRLNRAVDYLADYGIAEVTRSLNTGGFTFAEASANFRTIQFADQE